MVSVLLLLGQCICVIGLIYAALLATVSIDWLEDLPADSLKPDSLTRHDSVRSCVVEQGKGAANRLRLL